MAQITAFTQNELILLTKTHADIKLYAHEIENDDEHGWELRIQYEDKPHKRHQTMTLATARGNIRLFKNLDTVITYIKEHCPRFDEFVVYFGNKPIRRVK